MDTGPGSGIREPGAGGSRPGFVLAVLSLAFLLGIIDRMVFSLLIAPIKADLSLTDTQAGELAGIAFGLFYMIMGLPLGRLADRINRPRLICAGLALWSLATAACGFATSFTALFAARVCVGIGEAAISPAAYSLLADYFPKPRLARAISVYMMGTVVGIAIAWIAGGRLLASLDGLVPASSDLKPWNLVFIAAAAPGLALAPFLLAIREVRNERPGPAGTQAGGVLAAGRQLLRGRGGYAAHFTAVAALNTYGFALLSWAPTMFVREFGWPLGKAGPVLGLSVGAAGIAGMYGAGALVDRLARAGWPDASYRLMLYASLGIAPFAGMPLLTHSPGSRLALFLVPAMTSFFMLIACAPTALQVVTPPPLRGSISAVYLFVVNVSAFLIGPTLVGAIADHYKGAPTGLATAVAIVGMTCVPIAIAALLLGSRPFALLAERSALSEQGSPDEVQAI